VSVILISYVQQLVTLRSKAIDHFLRPQLLRTRSGLRITSVKDSSMVRSSVPICHWNRYP